MYVVLNKMLVYCKLNTSYSPVLSPWSVSGVRTVEARVGFSVAIPCNQPTSNPPSHVAWTVNGGPLTAGDVTTGAGEDQRIQVFPDGHLVIHDLRSSDFNVSYHCLVDNANIYNTSISPQITRLIEGMSHFMFPQHHIHVCMYWHMYACTLHILSNMCRIVFHFLCVDDCGTIPFHNRLILHF